MLDKDQIAGASRVLHQHWRAGTKLDGLASALRPRDRLEGYAIQAELERTSAQKLFGWKIAATSGAGQKHINVPGPMAGIILAETVIADGGTASMAGNEMAVAEPEFAFRMGRDLRRARCLTPSPRCSMRSPPCIQRSSFRIRAMPISSAPAKRRSLQTTPARIYLCWVRLRQRTGVRWTWSKNGRSRCCAASSILVMARTCSGIPALR